MKKYIFTLPSADGKTTLHGIRWDPEGETAGVLQISHGMAEYLNRYEEFAEYLTAAGFAVIGHDHLGHGLSVTNDGRYGYFADENGDRILLQDMHRINVLAKKKYPGKPVFILGHSMGSFLLRRYITIFGGEIDGALICGTGSIGLPQTRFGLTLTHVLIRIFGRYFHSRLIDLLALGQYVLQYGNPIRRGSWLSKNEESVRAYRNDPLCGFRFTVGAYDDFFRVLKSLAEEKDYQRIPRELPLILLSGMDDPLGQYSKAVLAVYNRYREIGMKDLDILLYPGDRHEILNETDRDVVYADILAWLRAHLKARG